MDQITSFFDYIEQHRIRDIAIGQSGANVCEISGDRIAKHIQRNKLNDERLWSLYTREAEFYQYTLDLNLPFVPEVLHINCTKNELLLILKKYLAIDRNDIADTLLDKVISTLAQVHAIPVSVFIPKAEAKPIFHTEESIAEYMSGWSSVLAEHGDAFQTDVLQDIARNINEINKTLKSTRQCFTHGDFHFDNLLMDENGNIIVCDWQGCGTGDPSGDLSFFISRLLSDGYAVDANKLVNTYCRYANRLGMDINPTHVHTQMCLANLNTSFVFWHQYLHNTTIVRVRDIYEKMVEDYRRLADRLLSPTTAVEASIPTQKEAALNMIKAMSSDEL